MTTTELNATGGPVTEQAKPTAPSQPPAKKRARRRQSKAPSKPQKVANAKTNAARAKQTQASNQAAKAIQTQGKGRGSKGASILTLIARVKGATLAEIMEATSWQAHSVRGFLATSPKKHSLKLESVKNEKGERVYRVLK
jgi:hypothetical protein